MKQLSEERTENAVKTLLQTLITNYNDTGKILCEYEMTHTEYERDQSRQYSALVMGHFALKETIDTIKNQLNIIGNEKRNRGDEREPGVS